MDDIKACVKPVYKDLFETINDMLSEVPTDEPFYVADFTDVIAKYRLWTKKLPRVHPYYAVKTNPDKLMLQIMASLGAGFDCASKEEIEMVLAAGASPSDIIYAHPFKSCSYLCHAKLRDVDLLTFDSEGELFKIKDIYPCARLVIRFRVPNVTADFPLNNKFGCEIEECRHLLKVAKRLGLDVIGTCFHVGGLCREPMAYSRAIKMARKVFNIAEQLGYCFTLLDLGGGYPGDTECQETFNKMCCYINQSLQEHFPKDDVQIIAEPGCFFACSAFTLCTTIIGKKKVISKGNKNKTEKVLYYLNDGIYGSFAEMYEKYGVRMKPLLNSSELGHRAVLSSKLWGCTCCSMDCISEECLLPEMEIGEKIIFENMGAYTLCLTSNFNGFLKPFVRYMCRTLKKIEVLKPCAQENIPSVNKMNDWETFINCRKRLCDETDDSNTDLCRFG